MDPVILFVAIFGAICFLFLVASLSQSIPVYVVVTKNQQVCMLQECQLPLFNDYDHRYTVLRYHRGQFEEPLVDLEADPVPISMVASWYPVQTWGMFAWLEESFHGS